jgi:hypothetical protein
MAGQEATPRFETLQLHAGRWRWEGHENDENID